jgi:hypothetical protein
LHRAEHSESARQSRAALFWHKFQKIASPLGKYGIREINGQNGSDEFVIHHALFDQGIDRHHIRLCLNGGKPRMIGIRASGVFRQPRTHSLKCRIIVLTLMEIVPAARRESTKKPDGTCNVGLWSSKASESDSMFTSIGQKSGRKRFLHAPGGQNFPITGTGRQPLRRCIN